MAEQFVEGQTATNPQTGAKIVWRGGTWKNATAADNGNTDSIVNALVEGRMSFPTDSRALNKPYWQNLMAKVSEKDPKFDTIDYKARARTRQDFTSGKSAQNITSFNTLLHHIGTLQKKADELGNYGGVFTPLNAGANYAAESFGSEDQTNFRQAKNAVVGEAVRAFRGVGGARGDIEEAANAIPENGSPEQIKGALKTLAALLEGRIQSLGEQYGAGMGKASNGINLLDKDAQATLAQLGIGQKEGGDPQSGAAGAGDGSDQPPPGPGTGGRPEGELTFNDQLPQESAQGKPLTDEQRAALQAVAQSGGTAAQITALGQSFGVNITAENADALAKFYSDPKNRNVAPVVNEDRTVKPVDPGDGSFGAFARGITSNVPFSREIAAGIESFADPNSTYAQNIDEEYGKRAFVEENNGTAYTLGGIAGALPLGAVEIAGARAASLAAGRAAVRGGASAAEARVIANRTYAMRTAAEAAGMSGIYSAGNADGSALDRAGAGAVGSVVGGVLGGGAALAGGRFARAMAARRGAAAVARPAEGDIARRAAAAGGPTEAQLFGEAAQRRGVEYLPADVPGSTATRMASGITNMTLGGIPLAEAATRSIGTAKTAKDAVAEGIGVVGDTTFAGQSAQRGARSFVQSSERRGSQLYEAIPIPARTDTTLGNTRQALTEIVRGLDSNPELSRLWTENPRLKATLDAITPGTQGSLNNEVDTASAAVDSARAAFQATKGQATIPAREALQAAQDVLKSAQAKAARGPEAGLSWEDLKRFRSIVGEIAGNPSLTSDGAQNAAMKKLYGALSEDMRLTAEATSPEAAKAFNRANRFWRGRQDRIDNVISDILGDDLQKSPDAAFRAIEQMAQKKGGDSVKLARAIRSLPDDEANTVRATVLDRLGLANPGRQDATGEVYSPATFMSQWNSLSPRAKSTLFQGEHKAAIDDLVRIADGMKSAQQFANTSRTSLGTNALATAATFWANPLLGIGSVSTQLGAGKLLASPKFAKWLAKAPKKPNIKAQRDHVAALTRIARSEPAIANDVLALQSRLADAFGAAPARLAAEPSGNESAPVQRQQSDGEAANQRLQP